MKKKQRYLLFDVISDQEKFSSSVNMAEAGIISLKHPTLHHQVTSAWHRPVKRDYEAKYFCYGLKNIDEVWWFNFDFKRACGQENIYQWLYVLNGSDSYLWSYVSQLILCDLIMSIFWFERNTWILLQWKLI